MSDTQTCVAQHLGRFDLPATFRHRPANPGITQPQALAGSGLKGRKSLRVTRVASVLLDRSTMTFARCLAINAVQEQAQQMGHLESRQRPTEDSLARLPLRIWGLLISSVCARPTAKPKMLR